MPTWASQAALDKIPPDTGVIAVMRSDQLAAAEAGNQAIRVLSTLLLVLFALTVYLARGERRRDTAQRGWAFVLVGLAVLMPARGQLRGRRTHGDGRTRPGSAGLVDWQLDPGPDGMGGSVYGVAIVLGAVLAGLTQRAVAVRRRLAPGLGKRPGDRRGGRRRRVHAAPTVPARAPRVIGGIVLLGPRSPPGCMRCDAKTLQEFPAVD